jgi:hypothetical protein
MSWQHKGLGEHPSWDGRDSLHLMRPILEAAASGTSLPDERLWRNGRISDQGSEGACVGHGWTSWLNCRPVSPKDATQERYYNDEWAYKVYREAQKVDEWPGEDYDGTSTRAGAEIMRERKFLTRYVHAATYSEMSAFVRGYGPVVVACRWDEASYEPDAQGYLRHGGRIVGGHCFCVVGVYADGDLLAQNSWGESFALEGLFKITKNEWLYRMRMGHASMISAAQLVWADRREIL